MDYSLHPFILSFLLVLTIFSAQSVQGETTESNNTTENTAPLFDMDTAPASSDTHPHRHLDWYEYSDRPDENVPEWAVCKGRFIPSVTANDTNSDENGPINIYADEATYGVDGYAEFEGDVEIRMDGRQMRANKARANQSTQTLDLEGDIQLRTPELLINSERGSALLEKEEVTFEDSEYVIYQEGAHGEAQRIFRHDNMTELDKGSFTFCQPDDVTWKIKAAEIDLDHDEGFGTAKHMTMNIYDVPVFYSPYFKFPIDDQRHTGILYPSLNIDIQTNEGNIHKVLVDEFALPIYFNLAPNYDATYTPRYLERHGIIHEGEFRYLNEYSMNRLNVGFLNGDKFYDSITDDNNLGNSPEDEAYRQDLNDLRWIFGFYHQGGKGPWSTYIDYTEVSDKRYLDDLDTELKVDRAVQLIQQAGVRYNGGWWNFNGTFKTYQVLNEDQLESAKPYSSWPQLTFTANDTLQDYNLLYGAKLEYTYFDKRLEESELTDNEKLDPEHNLKSQRFLFSPEASATYEWPWAYITPSAYFFHKTYQMQNHAEEKDSLQMLNIPSISLDSTLFFDRDASTPYDTFTQTLEPRLFFLATPFQKQEDIPVFDTVESAFNYQSLFRNNRFIGNDRVGDTTQLSWGVTSRLLDQDGNEFIKFDVGQALYFRDRMVRLNSTDTLPSICETNPNAYKSYCEKQSSMQKAKYTGTQSYLTGEATINMSQSVSIRSTYTWDQYINQTDNGRIDMYFTPTDRHLFALGYLYEDALKTQALQEDDLRYNTQTLQASTIFPVTNHIRAFGSIRYELSAAESLDLENARDQTAGLEYNSCCWRFRWLYRRELNRDAPIKDDKPNWEYGTFFELEFKGLGAIGKNMDRFLNDAIYGFDRYRDKD